MGNVQLHNKNEASKNVAGRATILRGMGLNLGPGLGCCFPGSEHTKQAKCHSPPAAL